MFNLQESLPKEIKNSVDPVPLKTEIKLGTSSVVKDTGPVDATVCPQCLETSIPVTTDPAGQLNEATKITGKETVETLKDIKQAEAMEKPEGETQNDAKPEQIGASTVQTGLVSKDKDIVDKGTESNLQEKLDESKSRSTVREMVSQYAVSEDQQNSVSFLAAVPIWDTTPQEDTALVY